MGAFVFVLLLLRSDFAPAIKKPEKVKILGASPEAFDIRLYELETKQASGN